MLWIALFVGLAAAVLVMRNRTESVAAGTASGVSKSNAKRQDHGAPRQRNEVPQVPPLLQAAIDGQNADLGQLAVDGAANLACLAKLIEVEDDPRKLVTFLRIFGSLSTWTWGGFTPDRMQALARHPDPEVRYGALEVAARVSDEAGVQLLCGILAEGDVARPSAIVHSAIAASRFSHAAGVATTLNRYLDAGLKSPKTTLEALQSLQYSGQPENLEPLRKLAEVENHPRIRVEARFALQGIEALSACDREERLMNMIRIPIMAGSFSWSRWALERIVRLNLRDLAPQLRAHFDSCSHLWSETGPGSFRNLMLEAIHRLGGALTASETQVLCAVGRIH